jgi:hypothetical protein
MSRPPQPPSILAIEPDPVIEVYKRDVDRTLVRAQLRRSVDERVDAMLNASRLATALHEAGAAGRKK